MNYCCSTTNGLFPETLDYIRAILGIFSTELFCHHDCKQELQKRRNVMIFFGHFFGNNFYLTLIYLHLLNCFCLCFAIIFYCLFTKESIKCMIDCTLVSELVLRISWNCTGTDFGIMATSVERKENPKCILPKQFGVEQKSSAILTKHI